ncbi:MAG: serpin family protein [Chloroflexota bacterium]|nr:serpin family protein [Chloroflexota bacterium]
MRPPLPAALAVLLAVAACSPGPPAATPPGGNGPTATPPRTQGTVPSPVRGGPIREIRAERERASLDGTRPAAVRDVVASDGVFALGLYQAVASGASGNLFLSPYSISTALSMTYAGARGETASQLADALGVPADPTLWHEGRNGVDLQLGMERQVPEGITPLTLEPTNGLFGQDGFPFEQEYLDTLAVYYGAGMQAVDFAAAPDIARGAVNEWVKQRTADRIAQLLPPESVDELTRFVLVNAIYFKANWLQQFDPDATRDRPFILLGGPAVDVRMMHANLRSGYGLGRGWEAIRLAYAGNASMLVIVPDTDRFDEIESRLDADLLEAVRDSLTDTSVDLVLPRWESASRIDLEPALEAMGVTDLFGPSIADLTGIAPVEDLYVSAALHQANITVDEEGTEAAAATAVVGDVTSAPGRSVELVVDRPFLYVVEDDVTGEILFVGRVLDPSAG